MEVSVASLALVGHREGAEAFVLRLPLEAVLEAVRVTVVAFDHVARFLL